MNVTEQTFARFNQRYKQKVNVILVLRVFTSRYYPEYITKDTFYSLCIELFQCGVQVCTSVLCMYKLPSYVFHPGVLSLNSVFDNVCISRMDLFNKDM